MAQSVELVLDAALDAAVRHQWQALADAGLRSLAHHTGASNRPHVTLAVAHDPLPDHVEAAVADAVAGAGADGLLPLEVRLGGLVLFTHRHRHVLARLVVPSSRLLRLQTRIAAAVGAAGQVPHTEPGAWTPHVTLARSAPAEQVATALAALAVDGVDLVGTGTEVRRWDGAARREWPLK